jgi:hypothetical protein
MDEANEVDAAVEAIHEAGEMLTERKRFVDPKFLNIHVIKTQKDAKFRYSIELQSNP